VVLSGKTTFCKALKSWLNKLSFHLRWLKQAEATKRKVPFDQLPMCSMPSVGIRSKDRVITYGHYLRKRGQTCWRPAFQPAISFGKKRRDDAKGRRVFITKGMDGKHCPFARVKPCHPAYTFLVPKPVLPASAANVGKLRRNHLWARNKVVKCWKLKC